MDRQLPLSLAHHSRELPDPRLGRLCRHELPDVIGIAICAVLCGQHTWADIAFYGQGHQAWLRTFLRLPNGAPSHDTFRSVFTRLDPAALQRCFGSWIAALSAATGLARIAIDGKTPRGSLGRGHGQAPSHLVSAWASANHVTLGQVAVADKSDEITAIPRLLEVVDVSGAVVTIGALGCQKGIAAKVRGEGADYVLAVKDNQPRLLADIQGAVTAHLGGPGGNDPACQLETLDFGHGRKGVRTYLLPADLSVVRDRALWQDLRGICFAVNERTVAGETSTEARYYIGSPRGSVADYAQVIRDHGGIEDKCHWVLDVLFREDGRRARPEHGAEDLAWLRRMAVSLLKSDTTCERGLRAKSAKAPGDHDSLPQLLSQVTGDKEGA